MNGNMKIKLNKKKSRYCLLLFFFFWFCMLPLRAQFYSVQTNFAKLAVGSFNAEASITVNLHWSVQVGMEYNPWTFRNNHKIKNLTFTPAVRYWFPQSYIGPFVRSYLSGSRYNFTWNGHRYDGSGLGGGATYGYAFLLGRRWNLELEGGAGMLWGRHMKYDCQRCGARYGKETRAFLIPQVAVNLVYLF